MNLTALVASASMLLAQGDFTETKIHYQKPPIYAQAPQDAITKNENLERMLAVYRNLVFKGYSKRAMEMALDFYEDIIKESKNELYVAEAYLNSGIILCCMIDPKNLNEGKKRLEEAYKMGDYKIKVEAAYQLARVHFGYGGAKESDFSLKEAKKYLLEVIRLAPQSHFADEAKTMLKQLQQK